MRKELKNFYENFSKTEEDFPQDITAYIRVGKKIVKEIVIPLNKIFREGNWLSRVKPGISLLKVEEYLELNGHLSGIYGNVYIGIK